MEKCVQIHANNNKMPPENLGYFIQKKKKKKSQQNVLEEIKKKTFHYGTGYNSSENYKNCKYFYT